MGNAAASLSSSAPYMHACHGFSDQDGLITWTPSVFQEARNNLPAWCPIPPTIDPRPVVMNEDNKSASRDTPGGSHDSPATSEPSSTPPSSEARSRPYFSTASDGRVTLTFPSSGAWSAQYQASSPQPARYEPVTPASELSIGEVNPSSHEKPVPLRLMTDESLAAMLDSNNAESGAHPNPRGGDLEDWIESSKQTIIRKNDQGGREQAQGGDKSRH
ncbi:hypothetical protein FRC11_004905, partial [Ceratobasidium sp. 423]